MISIIRKHSRKVSLFLMLLTIFMALNGFTLEGEEESGCKKAFKSCVDDAEELMPHLTLFYNYLNYCLVGYVFCVKYLEK